jgi:hypothetical protein
MAQANLDDVVANGVTVQDLINAVCIAIQPYYQSCEVAEWLGLDEQDADKVIERARAVRSLATE